MIDHLEISEPGRTLGVHRKRWVAQGIGYVGEGSRLDATPVSAYFPDFPDGKRATIRGARIAIAV